MREEYDIKNLNPRKNPYASKLKKQITINIDSSTVDFFKSLSDDTGIPYQTLINLYLRECVQNNKKPMINILRAISKAEASEINGSSEKF